MRVGNLLIVTLFLCGCSNQDNDLLTKVAERTGKKLEVAAGGTPSQFAGRLRSSARPFIGLAERVETRLAWDRYLAGIELLVEPGKEGVVVIKGNVPDLAKKERVLDLARSTIGVKEVVDQLILPKE